MSAGRRFFVRLLNTKRENYERVYPGIGSLRLAVVNRVDVPPGDYIAPLVGVRWKRGTVAWLYEKDTVAA